MQLLRKEKKRRDVMRREEKRRGEKERIQKRKEIIVQNEILMIN